MEPQQVMNKEDVRYTYSADWHDPVSGIMMAFTVLHWPHVSEVELIDARKRKMFLKRTRCDGAGGTAPLRPGSTMTVMARRLRILSPADDATRTTLTAASAPMTRTFAMVKPDVIQHLGAILTAAHHAGLTITQLRMARLSSAEAAEFYAVHRHRPFFPQLQEFMTSGPVVAMQLEGVDAVAAWRALLGPTNSAAARVQDPASLRARFGTDNTRNACHGSDAAETAAQEAAFFFGGQAAVGRLPLPAGADVTAAVIKPNAVAQGHAGPMIEHIQAQFDIVAAEAVRLTPGRAEQFHKVYKGVVTSALHSAMVQELSSGIALALALMWQPGDPPQAVGLVDALRKLAGPADPELAAAAAPGSLRAEFGETGARNALHVTDLAGDGALEAGFFFPTA